MSLRRPLVREALFSAAAAASVAAALAWLGPPGTDFAAHAYQRTLFLEHGFTLWNNYWYAGRYSFVTYSVFYYPLAALLGIRLLAVEPHLRGGLGRDRALGGVSLRTRDGDRAARDLGTAGGGAVALRRARHGHAPG